MKNLQRLLVCLLVLIICLAFTACGSSLAVLEPGYEANFRGLMVELNGEYAALSDIYEGDNYIKLYENGKGVLAFSGDEEPITWSKNGENYEIILLGEVCPATVKDGIMVIEIDGGIVTYVAEGAEEPIIPTTQLSDYDKDLSSPYGKYHGLTINQYGIVQDMTDFYNGECYLLLNTTGMGEICLGGTKTTIAWDHEDGNITIADINGINSIGIISDGVVVIDYMEFGIQLAFAKEGAEP